MDNFEKLRLLIADIKWHHPVKTGDEHMQFVHDCFDEMIFDRYNLTEDECAYFYDIINDGRLCFIKGTCAALCNYQVGCFEDLMREWKKLQIFR